MKNIDLLPVDAATKKRLTAFANEYRKMARIYIEIVSFKDDRVIVRAEQKESVNGKILTKGELVERVRDMFSGEVPWKLTVSAVNFDRRDIASVNPEWIQNNMNRLGLKSKDLARQMGLSYSDISRFLSGERNLSKAGKAAFYYFIKYHEMSMFNRPAE